MLGISRCWRFGQTRSVHVDIVTTEGERGVLANMETKAARAEVMFQSLVNNMNEATQIERQRVILGNMEVPSWL